MVFHGAGEGHGGCDCTARANVVANMSQAVSANMSQAVSLADGFGGIMHLRNNLAKDTHQALPAWKGMLPQLKQLESFCSINERVERFLWTCVRNVDSEETMELFRAAIKGPLYEARWHEVVKWLSSMQQILWPLTVLWNEDKVSRWVDSDRASRPSQLEVELEESRSIFEASFWTTCDEMPRPRDDVARDCGRGLGCMRRHSVCEIGNRHAQVEAASWGHTVKPSRLG